MGAGLGYAISRPPMCSSLAGGARRLGPGFPPQLGPATLLGFAFSSCSFAALSATCSLVTQGAALTSALAWRFGMAHVHQVRA